MSASKNAIAFRTSQHTRRWNVILLLALFLPVIALAQYRARAAVELVYFRASGVSNGVLLEWETASELDNLGFFVNRSLSRDSGYTQASAFIPTSGDPLLGGYYQYIDTNVALGTTYWYKLESVDIQSVPEMYEPPVSVMAGTGQTTTPTRTATVPASNQQTGTATPTATARTRTPTVTSTARDSLSDAYTLAEQPLSGCSCAVRFPAACPGAVSLADGNPGTIRQWHFDRNAGYTHLWHCHPDPIA